ncbi:homeobox protein PKNOX2-like isoform X2 [Ostrea edulis]|uniref:homeobox protein PKNOX2-like isoform X2 n=1 Tax=Ostrea edulis TaxID=37623 RepID=UPI0024AFC9FE|nr:homeobox protein PKNOX2-like isoform X2 [Ostrea edulis]XP_056010255.1 homeobox protein PKNOX2-like isoform X2 [Ostrea edulis]XP_056010256.1 homeobox protein PKNOX2-like isoform X2 [Ostrea edulis]XP_056010257.1 homeobox protein PKNOX2-like isoform X2 [Ostrea edulis]
MSMVQGLPPTYTESKLLNKGGNATSSDVHSSVESMGTITIQEINDAQYEEEKKRIYGHPLFPLMELLFVKCEQASQTSDCPSSDSFDVDIQTFVQRQEKERKPFFSDDAELDNLMVKSIQVLRIHLLELEKVNELCKDFCNRYINCLKGKLQSEQLLRVDTDFDDFSEHGCSPPLSGGQGSGTAGVVSSTGMVIQQSSSSMPTLNQVYQMVQTPQGLVAQPIQTPIVSSPVIQGNTTLTQLGIVNSQSAQSSSALDSDDDDPLGKKKSKRGVLPKQATQVMKSWLFQHIVHPYPTEDEKRQIASQTNLTLLQVNNWFINARRRILQPMLDASNPEPTKKAKSKPQNRPLQRFWPESIANIQPQLPSGMQASVKSEASTTVTDTIQTQPIVIPIVTVPAESEQEASSGQDRKDSQDLISLSSNREAIDSSNEADPH